MKPPGRSSTFVAGGLAGVATFAATEAPVRWVAYPFVLWLVLLGGALLAGLELTQDDVREKPD